MSFHFVSLPNWHHLCQHAIASLLHTYILVITNTCVLIYSQVFYINLWNPITVVDLKSARFLALFVSFYSIAQTCIFKNSVLLLGSQFL